MHEVSSFFKMNISGHKAITATLTVLIALCSMGTNKMQNNTAKNVAMVRSLKNNLRDSLGNIFMKIKLIMSEKNLGKEKS